MREEEQHNNNRQDGSHAQQGEGHEQECSALQEVCARLAEDHRARGTHDALEPQRSHREAARGAESVHACVPPSACLRAPAAETSVRYDRIMLLKCAPFPRPPTHGREHR